MIMKFKDAYKEMTDEIHGDRALLHSILNGECKKEKSFFKHFSYGRTLASFAVCFVLVVAVFVSYNHFNHSSSPENTPSEADISSTPQMVRQIEAPLSDDASRNSEYYGEILNRIFEITPDKSGADVADDSYADPLSFFISYPGKDTPSQITISKVTDLSSVLPEATCAELDGIHIVISSDDKATEKEILQKLLK